MARTPTARPDPIFFTSPAELRDWLDANHGTADELYVGAWKKSTGRPSVTWEEIVEEALCVGWIDSVRRSVPDDGWTIRLTPRRAGSNWSRINIAKIAELRAAGRLRPAGEAAFAARLDDRSGAHAFESDGEPRFSPEQEATFRATPAAWAWFAARAPSYRRNATLWVVSAKRPETRERRLRTLIEDSAAGHDVPAVTGRPRPG